MKNVIVTGAGGFIGSHVVKELIRNGIHVLAIDLPKNKARVPEDELVQFLGVDVFQLESVLADIDKNFYDTFYHFAWVGSAGPARANYALQMQNAICTVECLKIAKRLGCKRFVGAGSIMEHEVMSAVFAQGNQPGMGYIYGTGKWTAHSLCKSVAASEGIDLLWAMITNAYGEGERSPRFINTTIRKIINNEPLQFTSGTQNYDFIHVLDVARAFVLIGEKGLPFCEYVIGSGQAKPLKEFILELGKTLAPDQPLIFGDIPFTGVNLPVEVFSTKKIEEDCAFYVEIPFSEGITRTMKWLSEGEAND